MNRPPIIPYQSHVKLSYQKGLYSLYQNERCYVFSDEEGYSPFGYDTHIDRFGNDLQFKDVGMVENNQRKIISDIGSNVKLVFLGDLVDNGKNSIRLLQSMTQLKARYPDRVILIGGNRDYNKIRMYDEYLIVKNDNTELNLDEIFNINIQDPFQNLIDQLNQIANGGNHKFKFLIDDNTEIKNRICGLADNGFGGWAGVCKDINKNMLKDKNLNTFQGRVEFMYGSTLGAAPDTLGRYDELKEIWKLPSDLKIEQPALSVLICLTNMIMSKKDNKYSNNPFIKDLNGLYEDYISKSHIIAVLHAGKKEYIFSHGGIPNYLYTFGFDPRYLENKVGIKNIDDVPKIAAEQNKNTRFTNLNDHTQFKEAISIEEIITNINEDVDALADNLRKSQSMNFRDSLIIQKFTYLTAGDGKEPGHIGCSYSPVGWIQWGKKVPNPLTNNYIKTEQKQIGGSWWNDMKNVQWMDMNKYYKSLKNQGKELYIIFGHVPQGVAPTIWKKPESPHYICMDVSKAEGNFSYSSYAVYSIKYNESNDVIIGNTFFIKSDPNREYFSDNVNISIIEDLKSNPINIPYTIDVNSVKFDSVKTADGKFDLSYRMSINYKDKKYDVFAGTFQVNPTPPPLKFVTFCKFVEIGQADKQMNYGNFFFDLYRKNKEAYAKI